MSEQKDKRKKIEKDFKTDLIFNAFKALIKRKSWHLVTIQDIANECGYGKATIYSYFRSKQDILIKLIEENFSKHYKFLKEQKESNVSSADKIRNYSKFRYKFMKESKKQFGGIEMVPILIWLKTTKEGNEYFSLEKEIVALVKYSVNYFTDIFRALVRADNKFPPKRLAWYYISSLNALMANIHLNLMTDSEIKEMIETLHYFLLGGEK